MISAASRGQARPVCAMHHYHYNRRLYLGGFDQLGFGALMYAK